MLKKALLITTITLNALSFTGISPMKGLADSTVIATINGKKVTVKKVNTYMQGITGNNKITLQNLPAKQAKQFIFQYIENFEIYNSKAKNITKTPQYKVAAQKLAIDIWLKNRLQNIKITDKEAKTFYNKNKNIYFRSTLIKARHIVVKDEKLAQKLINELKGLKGKALEKKFAELAKKYSIGPSNTQGGELGYFDPKNMPPAFAAAATKLKVGHITLKPVQTRFGYHVILLEDKNTKNYIPFNKAKGQIVSYLKRVKLEKEIKKIKNSNKVKYLIPIK